MEISLQSGTDRFDVLQRRASAITKRGRFLVLQSKGSGTTK